MVAAAFTTNRPRDINKHGKVGSMIHGLKNEITERERMMQSFFNFNGA